MLSLSRTTWSRKGVAMVLVTAKLKNRKSTIQPGMRGRDAAKELTLKVNISKVFTTVFSETKSIVNRNSKLAGPSKSAWRWTSWHSKITRTVSLKRNSKDTKDNGISPWISQAKTRLCAFDQIFELQSLSKTVFIVSLAKRLHNQFLHSSIGDGTLPQAILGGTRPKVGGAHDFF